MADAPYFSLSHSGELAVVAVARVPVGIDVQRVPSEETVELVERRLHPEERREVRELPPERRPFALASVWARKEAYLKGLGTGLAHGLGHVYLGGRPGVAGAPVGWLVRDLPGDGRHAMAVAVAVARHGAEGLRIVSRALPTGPVA
ncbi:4'-phosphopantetheinyl transferase superfamily protein [Streptomyces diastatochromogenes]|nr:4'-phosphopantetheinyl transferase superfamily protein [Streptomyces diastatochromogenes]